MRGANEQTPGDGERPHLLRRFGMLEATALNMSNMIGIGPFITIPLLLTALAFRAGGRRRPRNGRSIKAGVETGVRA